MGDKMSHMNIITTCILIMLVIIQIKAEIYCLINWDETILYERHLVEAINSLTFLVEKLISWKNLDQSIFLFRNG